MIYVTGRSGSGAARSTATGTSAWSRRSSPSSPSPPTPRTASPSASSPLSRGSAASGPPFQIFLLAPNIFCSSLKPDFLLLRQDPRDAGEDFKSCVLGLQYGQVPSINSLQSVYNFQVSSRNIYKFILQFSLKCS